MGEEQLALIMSMYDINHQQHINSDKSTLCPSEYKAVFPFLDRIVSLYKVLQL